jgi:hypothetical protein
MQWNHPKFEDIKIGDIYRVISNRNTPYGHFSDVQRCENLKVKVTQLFTDQHIIRFTDIDETTGYHRCQVINLEIIKKSMIHII